MSVRQGLREGLVGPLEELGVDLEEVEVSRAGRRDLVRIIIDRDGGVDLDLVASVSQRVSGLLDEPPLNALLSGPFVLEVTSPGVDRPLTELRHWRRAIDRRVRVERADASVVEGRIVSVADDGLVQLDADGSPVMIRHAEVSRAVVQVEFTRAPSAGQDTADGDLLDDEEHPVPAVEEE